jgi:hypothetical protein
MAKESNSNESNIDGANKSKFTAGLYLCGTIMVGVIKVNRVQRVVVELYGWRIFISAQK